MTRVVQADIWARQFPADSRAEGTRFLHANWLPVEGHSVGSQLHVMTSLLSLAMASGHVLVPRTGSFERARHEHCSGEGQGTLGCYFWPVTSVACEEQAVHLSTLTPPGGDQLPYVLTVVDSDLPIVSIREGVLGPWHQGTEIAKKWKTPWLDRPVAIEVLGSVPDESTEVSWWRSQALRFFLRWPSPHLCHTINRVRHEAYGLRVASEVTRALWAQHLIGAGDHASLVEGEGDILQHIDLGQRSLLDTVWADVRPYVMRPIASLHVRQGGGDSDAGAFSLAAHVWLLQRLRVHEPGLHHVWLSSEVQDVMNQAAVYRDWTFWYAQEKRGDGGESDPTGPESSEGDSERELMGLVFANLMISSECDYFVGTLGSNTARMINELRQTNGRLEAGYISPNNGDW